MQINVSQQLREPIGSTRSYQVDDLVEITGDERRVEGKVSLVRTDRGILARGTLETQVDITCSRCLSESPCALSLAIEEEFFPTTDVLTGAPVPVPDDAAGSIIDEHHILDLTETIRQYAVLSLPMKPLCQEDCAGLCPTCGHNLNNGPCECPNQEMDPRWAALRGLAASDDKG